MSRSHISGVWLGVRFLLYNVLSEKGYNFLAKSKFGFPLSSLQAKQYLNRVYCYMHQHCFLGGPMSMIVKNASETSNQLVCFLPVSPSCIPNLISSPIWPFGWKSTAFNTRSPRDNVCTINISLYAEIVLNTNMPLVKHFNNIHNEYMKYWVVTRSNNEIEGKNHSL